jgi:hypothetical protein
LDLTDALHKTRLLGVDEKLFKRITKRLLNSTLKPAPLTSNVSTANGLVKDTNEDNKTTEEQHPPPQAQAAPAEDISQDIAIDFSLFESSILRIQLLYTSNAEERSNYLQKKDQILSTSSAVITSITQLRSDLETAQSNLAQRKEYDVLADSITSNRLLRPREDQKLAIAKLNEEIAELERTRDEHIKTWVDRKEQFARLHSQAQEFRRVIRDEVAAPVEETGEGDDAEMGDGDDDAKESRRDGLVPMIMAPSNAPSPIPDMLEIGTNPPTPKPEATDFASGSSNLAGEANSRLKAEPGPTGSSYLAPSTPAPIDTTSSHAEIEPAIVSAHKDEGEVTEDVDMSDDDEGEIHTGEGSEVAENEVDQGQKDGMDTT